MKHSILYICTVFFCSLYHAQAQPNTLALRGSYGFGVPSGIAGVGASLRNTSGNYHTLEVLPFDEKIKPTAIDSVAAQSIAMRYGYNYAFGKKNRLTTGIALLAYTRESQHNYITATTPNTYHTNLLQMQANIGVNLPIGKYINVNATVPILITEIVKSTDKRNINPPNTSTTFGINGVLGFILPRVGIEIRIK